MTLRLVAENTGGSPAGGVGGLVELPAAFAVQLATGCVPGPPRPDASVWLCDAGQVNALSVSVAGEFQLLAPMVRGSFVHTASALGLDAGATAFTAVTGIGVASLDPTDAGRWDAGACQGTNVMSLSMCMPQDLVRDTLQFLPDGSIISDDGIPAIWAQSPSRRNICFQSFGALGGSLFRGESISPRCFAGFTDRWETGEANFAAWIACH